MIRQTMSGYMSMPLVGYCLDQFSLNHICISGVLEADFINLTMVTPMDSKGLEPT